MPFGARNASRAAAGRVASGSPGIRAIVVTDRTGILDLSVPPFWDPRVRETEIKPPVASSGVPIVTHRRWQTVRIQRVQTSNDEGGFTIIELVAALGILSIVAASLAGVFWSAIRTAGNATHRSDAAAIASREIESMRSFRYADIGFYADQAPGYAATFTDPDTGQVLNTVTLGTTTPTGSPSNIQPVTPDPNAATTYDPDPDP